MGLFLCTTVVFTSGRSRRVSTLRLCRSIRVLRSLISVCVNPELYKFASCSCLSIPRTILNFCRGSVNNDIAFRQSSIFSHKMIQSFRLIFFCRYSQFRISNIRFLNRTLNGTVFHINDIISGDIEEILGSDVVFIEFKCAENFFISCSCVLFSRGFICFFYVVRYVRDDDRRENTDNNDDYQQFNERKTLFVETFFHNVFPFSVILPSERATTLAPKRVGPPRKTPKSSSLQTFDDLILTLIR